MNVREFFNRCKAVEPRSRRRAGSGAISSSSVAVGSLPRTRKLRTPMSRIDQARAVTHHLGEAHADGDDELDGYKNIGLSVAMASTVLTVTSSDVSNGKVDGSRARRGTHPSLRGCQRAGRATPALTTKGELPRCVLSGGPQRCADSKAGSRRFRCRTVIRATGPDEALPTGGGGPTSRAARDARLEVIPARRGSCRRERSTRRCRRNPARSD